MSDATTAPDATEIAGKLRFSVTRLARLLRQQDHTGFAPTTLAALATISREGPLTLGELAAAEQVAPPTITKSVAKLADAGFVTRAQDSADRRIHWVAITELGQHELEASRSRRTAWLATRLRQLDPADLACLTDAVDALEQLTVAAPSPEPDTHLDRDRSTSTTPPITTTTRNPSTTR